jgi:hypothetical protein
MRNALDVKSEHSTSTTTSRLEIIIICTEGNLTNQMNVNGDHGVATLWQKEPRVRL